MGQDDFEGVAKNFGYIGNGKSTVKDLAEGTVNSENLSIQA
jgi:hypothetical protein